MSINTLLYLKNIKMKHLLYSLMLTTAVAICVCSCSDDDNDPTRVTPTTTGTFIDERDSFEYHWVRIGKLDWSCENLHYDLGNSAKCQIYQPAWADGSPTPIDIYSEKYGRLYTVSGAIESIPEGWRLPTDADWQQLEQAFGMSADETNKREWRGNIAQLLLEKGEGTANLGIQLCGYTSIHDHTTRTDWLYMSVFGYYWTATTDTAKNDVSSFYRKLAYNKKEVYRESTEAEKYFFSVRFVRDAQ